MKQIRIVFKDDTPQTRFEAVAKAIERLVKLFGDERLYGKDVVTAVIFVEDLVQVEEDTDDASDQREDD